MASGVAVNPQCLTAYQELKIGKKWKFIIYSLNDENTEVVVHKREKSKEYEDFLSHLPENQCLWAIYDFEYDSGEGVRNKLLFLAWSPDSAKIKQKMLYASSRDALRRALVGIQVDIQGTDMSEVAEDTVRSKLGNRS